MSALHPTALHPSTLHPSTLHPTRLAPSAIDAPRQPSAVVQPSALHPSDETATVPRPSARPVLTAVPTAPDEEGSLVTEYGLLAVVAATIAGVVISWASNGALVTLFNALLRHARGLVGA
jgi:Flp pilus assembly pilin Flp